MSSENTSDNPATGELNQGDRLGPYAIVRKLGSGGMADVYFAMHEELHRPAAIKVLRPSLAVDQSNLQRFMQEARAAASLVHPNIVQVYDVGQKDDVGNHKSVHYIAQEYVAGTNLRQYVEQHGTLSFRAALSVLLQTLAALKKSSSAGIVHRDIKPENILLTGDGDVKVTDFGLARLLHDDPQLTRAGTTLGTPMYMSPEQLQDGEVDVRSDLYSLGVTMFHMLAGKPPFSGETPLALAMQHVQAAPPRLNDIRPDVPKPLARLVDRLLAKLPQDRFCSPDEVLDFLRAERKNGLAEIWPEQTIPLPGADRLVGGAGPSPATLKLQAMLNRARSLKNRRWWAIGFLAMVSLLAAFAGVMVAQARPRTSMFGDSKNMYFGIARQATVQQQYAFALLNQNPRNRYLWDAVPHFFPPETSNTNRLYAGKAWLQVARQLRKSDNDEDHEAGKQTLRKIISDSEMPAVVKAIAWLELAVFANGKDVVQLEEAISRAVRIRNELSAGDDAILMQNVPESLREFISADRIQGNN